MSRASVYFALKRAIELRHIPHHSFQDDYATVLFRSWEEFETFDAYLDTVPTPRGIKLNIYAEEVDGRTDGVAVTVDDQVQHFTYYDRFVDAREALEIFEQFVAELHLHGIELLDFNIVSYTVTLDYVNLGAFNVAYKLDRERFYPPHSSHMVANRTKVNAMVYLSIHSHNGA